MPSTIVLELSGSQYELLIEALLATLTLSKFDMMLKQKLNINRENIALGDDYTDIVFRVVDSANRSGWVYKLVDAARQVRPNEPTFVEYARVLGIGPRGLPDATQLESLIKKTNAQFDIMHFRSRLGEIEGQVCRVDCQHDGKGTGFLVGPGAVLTNYHVVEDVVSGTTQLADYTCRFDFKVRADGVTLNKGTVFKVKDVLAYSPYDPADLKQGEQQPDPDKLDYALLALDGEPGNKPIGKGLATPDSERRGWMTMREEAYPFAPKSPLFIVQHPNKQPMKLALDTEAVIGLNGNNTRVRYTTNTEPGSSGSPCFNQDWELVALHHSGDPHWLPTWNEGIPIGLVLEQLNRKGFEDQFSG